MARPDKNDAILWPILADNRDPESHHYKLKPRRDTMLEQDNHSHPYCEQNNMKAAFVPVDFAHPSKQAGPTMSLVEVFLRQSHQGISNARRSTSTGQDVSKALPPDYKYLTPRQEQLPLPTSPPPLPRRCALVDFDQLGMPDDILLPAL
ncbi:expressed unknown protein [Seminavis robusta]|uniref:Uncharacterized protein n=1 Tax=Seminavis robusta TaxID=568900 RepID=A0A9N8E4V1_9STRA|nr:expressed unknown protein [Seminavis robusta]|eukprot:Sro621_g176800.1 n/a (149) ;mRNA; f:36637-37083